MRNLFKEFLTSTSREDRQFVINELYIWTKLAEKLYDNIKDEKKKQQLIKTIDEFYQFIEKYKI